MAFEEDRKFKGVVKQPNRKWGAQLYHGHSRIWLGTFNSQEEAALAYDRAACKILGEEAMTNFESVLDSESWFLDSHTSKDIIMMIKNKTYDRTMESERVFSSCTNQILPSPTDHFFPTYTVNMFDKILTPSDVGRLNRLVIPKINAEAHLPCDGIVEKKKGKMLLFTDENLCVWKFRYCYWDSSQSYVFTKGWSRFVKAKNLQVNDVVSFERDLEGKKFYISWRRDPSAGAGNYSVDVDAGCNSPLQKVFRLFGVDIWY